MNLPKLQTITREYARYRLTGPGAHAEVSTEYERSRITWRVSPP